MFHKPRKMASVLKISIIFLVVTADFINAAGGPVRRGSRRSDRLQKSINVYDWPFDIETYQAGPKRRQERNLVNVFPFVGGERGQIRNLDPVIHHARHEDHADHAEHALHHDEHEEHHGEHNDQHREDLHQHHENRPQHHEDHNQHHESQHQPHEDHHEHHEEPDFEPIPNTIFDSRSARQRNRGNDDVALDIGSIAAAGERCIDKVVMVQETEYDDVVTCKHSYSERCHTTYTTDFEPQQEEYCEENFIKECFIHYKKVANQESVEFCHTPLICEGEGPVECKTVYESQCETRYHPHDVEDDVVECETIQEEKCEDVTQGYTTEQKCTKWPKQVCETTTKRVTKHSPETDCRKIPRQLCGPSGCQLTAGPEECFDREETVVQEVPVENCNLEPQKSCKHVTKLVPLLKPVEECVDIPKEVCSRSRTNPRVVQKPVVKKWCYVPTVESGLA